MIELVYRTNIMAFVGTGLNENYPVNRVILWDDQKLVAIGEFNFKEPVLGIKLREDK